MTRTVRLLLGLLLGSVVLSGCDFDVYKLPLPGGTDVGSDPLTITVMFSDVLDLVPKSTVKVNDVNVGRVTDVDLDGYTAKVTLELRHDVKLPDNALAEIRQTSLLGEKFVSLSAPPEDPSPDTLGDGDVIPLDRAGRNPEIEEVLGALSLVLNGGGIAQLKTITQELNKALDGREDSARSLLDQVNLLATNLDSGKGDIVTAIESLNQLSLAASKQLPTIDAALAELPSALKSIDAQRAGLVKMLTALDDLSDVAVGVISKSKDSTIRSLQQLQPVLTQLADSGDAFVNAINTFYAYPFVDEAVGRDPQVARNLHIGDYTNLDAKLDVNLSTILPTDPIGAVTSLPSQLLTGLQKCIATGNPLSQECRSLPSSVLSQYCSQPANKNGPICVFPGVPGIPTALPSLPIGGLPGVTLPPIVPSGLGLGLGGLIGNPRAATGWAAPRSDGKGGPTVGQLQQAYDPSLVTLLVPGMMAAS